MICSASFWLSALLTLAPVQPVPDDVGFTGLWERNAGESDDPREKMREAMEQMREQGQMRGRMRGPRGGFGGGRRPPGGIGGPRPSERGGARPNLPNVADQLTLELRDGELHVDDGERLSIYYLDGETHKRELPNGVGLEAVAVRSGNAIVIEEKMERGQIDRKLELSPEGTILVMTVTIELGRMEEPVVIRTVYERAAG